MGKLLYVDRTASMGLQNRNILGGLKIIKEKQVHLCVCVCVCVCIGREREREIIRNWLK